MEELKGPHDSFSGALRDYLWDSHFPARTRTEILRAKRNESSVDESEGSNLVGLNDLSPASERQNEQNNDAEAVVGQVQMMQKLLLDKFKTLHQP